MLIYCIENKLNHKKYIGLTKRTIEDRWKQHLYESNKNDSWEWNTPLGNAIKKYGKDNFIVYVLEKCSSIEELKKKEIEFIASEKTLVQFGGYNLSHGGDGRLGYKLSEETKRKIGESNKGKTYTAESLKKMSIAAKKRSIGKLSPMDGKKHSEESLRKIRQASTGRIFSIESRKKKSESLKAYHLNKKLLNNGIQI